MSVELPWSLPILVHGTVPTGVEGLKIRADSALSTVTGPLQPLPADLFQPFQRPSFVPAALSAISVRRMVYKYSGFCLLHSGVAAKIRHHGHQNRKNNSLSAGFRFYFTLADIPEACDDNLFQKRHQLAWPLLGLVFWQQIANPLDNLQTSRWTVFVVW